MARPKLKQPNYKLQLRGSIFYAQWWQNGQWNRRSLETSDEDVASERLGAFSKAVPDPSFSMASWSSHTRPSHKGLVSETKAILRLLELGADVFIPWGHDNKADIVAGRGGVLKRIQVKTARIRGRGIFVRAASILLREGKATSVIVQPSECDFIIAYSPQHDECFSCPVTGLLEYRLSVERPLKNLEDVGINGFLAPLTRNESQ